MTTLIVFTAINTVLLLAVFGKLNEIGTKITDLVNIVKARR